jgi:hypothetical protein
MAPSSAEPAATPVPRPVAAAPRPDVVAALAPAMAPTRGAPSGTPAPKPGIAVVASRTATPDWVTADVAACWRERAQVVASDVVPLVRVIDRAGPAPGSAPARGQLRVRHAIREFVVRTANRRLRYLAADLDTLRRYLVAFENALVAPMTGTDFRGLWSDLRALVHDPLFDVCGEIEASLNAEGFR